MAVLEQNVSSGRLRVCSIPFSNGGKEEGGMISLWPHFAFGGLNLLQTGRGTDKSIAHLSGANV